MHFNAAKITGGSTPQMRDAATASCYLWPPAPTSASGQGQRQAIHTAVWPHELEVFCKSFASKLVGCAEVLFSTVVVELVGHTCAAPRLGMAQLQGRSFLVLEAQLGGRRDEGGGEMKGAPGEKIEESKGD
jgi:hypothetical protein